MKKCVFLTMDSLDGHVCEDDLLYEPLKKKGWDVVPISWHRKDVAWDDFEAVVIRSTWDYHNQVHDFLDVLGAIDRSKARLENDIRLVHWNANKSYLKDLKQKRIQLVPTRWGSGLGKNKILGFFDDLKAKELVIKPAVSACANDTYRVAPRDFEIMSRIESLSQDREFMVQPFMDCIVREGEFSLLYFGGEYSHTVLKKPKPDDFRVQEEYGGTNRLVEPEEGLLIRANETMNALDIVPLYARVDMVRQGDGFSLMELELIEPSLFLMLDKASPNRFATALNRRME